MAERRLPQTQLEDQRSLSRLHSAYILRFSPAPKNSICHLNHRTTTGLIVSSPKPGAAKNNGVRLIANRRSGFIPGSVGDVHVNLPVRMSNCSRYIIETTTTTTIQPTAATGNCYACTVMKTSIPDTWITPALANHPIASVARRKSRRRIIHLQISKPC